MAVRILLVDDHQIMREGLRALLEKQSDMEVIDEAQNGKEAIKLARQLKPDVVVMDVNMPDTDGIDATRRIIKELSGTKIIALSMYPKKAFAAEMLRAGASGYVLKENTFDELVKAIKTVMAGEIYLCAKVASVVVDDYVQGLNTKEAPALQLTEREREVLKMLADGKASKEIASIIDMSVQTVDACRRQIMDKLGVESIAELVKYAIREGITPLDD